jgi:hypothetical protein
MREIADFQWEIIMVKWEIMSESKERNLNC